MKHFIGLLFLCAMIGCSGDDDAVVVPSGLEGTWNLINVTGGLIGINENFKKGEIVWVFDTTSKQVKVTNNNGSAGSTQDLFPTGTYTYSIVFSNDTKRLIVNDINLGTLEMTTNEFTVDDQFADGFKYTFQR